MDLISQFGFSLWNIPLFKSLPKLVFFFFLYTYSYYTFYVFYYFLVSM